MSSETLEPQSTASRPRITRFFVPHPVVRWLLLRTCVASLGTLAFLGGCLMFYHERVGAPMPLPLAVVLVVAGVVGIGASVAFLFYHVAGPLFRVQREMGKIVDGESVEGIRLRPNDQLREFCDIYNQMLYKLELIDSKPEPQE